MNKTNLETEFEKFLDMRAAKDKAKVKKTDTIFDVLWMLMLAAVVITIVMEVARFTN